MRDVRRTKQRILREADQEDTFPHQDCRPGLPEQRQLLLFDLEPPRWPN